MQVIEWSACLTQVAYLGGGQPSGPPPATAGILLLGPISSRMHFYSGFQRALLVTVFSNARYSFGSTVLSTLHGLRLRNDRHKFSVTPMGLEGFEPPMGRSGGGCLTPGLATDPLTIVDV